MTDIDKSKPMYKAVAFTATALLGIAAIAGLSHRKATPELPVFGEPQSNPAMCKFTPVTDSTALRFAFVFLKPIAVTGLPRTPEGIDSVVFRPGDAVYEFRDGAQFLVERGTAFNMPGTGMARALNHVRDIEALIPEVPKLLDRCSQAAAPKLFI